MRASPFSTVLAFFTFLAISTIAGAHEFEGAREHFRRGTNAFNLGHYLEAVKEYEAAYQIKEDPALLFNIGQSYRLAGQNEAAVRVYKSFLHQAPGSPLRNQVEQRIAELQRLIEPQRKMQEAPPEGVLAPKPTDPALTPPPGKPVDVQVGWYHDPAAITMAALGIAGIAVGAGIGGQGSVDLGRAPGAADLQDHDNLRATGLAFSAGGYATFGVGVALCVGATIKWAVSSKRRRNVVVSRRSY
jgi:tetratricopeptide (TPR) repeat protein